MKVRKFHKTTGPRRQFLRILAGNLIMKGKIETTEARAKTIRPFVERCVEIGKKQTIASLRLLISRLSNKAANKVYYEIAPRYKERHGGYLRIMKSARFRKRDGAMVVTIEFV